MKLQFKNLYTLIARDVTTDAADNMNSIIKIIDKFTFPYNPDELKAKGVTLGKDVILFGVNYSVATAWHSEEILKKDELLSVRISIIDDDGNSRGGPAQESLVPAGIDRFNLNVKFDAMPVSRSGKHTLRAEIISKGGAVLATGEYPFAVELVEQKAQESQ